MTTGESAAAGGPFPFREALAFLQARLPEAPEVFLVLGSGLGALADAPADPLVIPFRDVPGFPGPGVEGHSGRLVFGEVEGRRVLMQAGRFHFYEGHSADLVVGPVRLAAALGARVLILTNAAGGIGRGLEPGSLMLLDDHIDLQGRSPLAGPVAEGETRFPDMSSPYDPGFQERAMALAGATGIPLVRGVYAAALGPSYETPAEVRALARLGAHAVGMSTVPEAIAASALGLRVLAVSLITNRAAGLGGATLDHREVIEVGRGAGDRLEALVRAILRDLPGRGDVDVEATQNGASNPGR